MTFLADRLARVKPSPTMAITALDPEPGRRGGDPGALLGVLSRDGIAVRRHAGAGVLLTEQRLQTAARGPRRGDHAEDQMADPELAVKPVGCRLYRSRPEGVGRGADEA